jgi:hypothetical protein
MANGFLDIYGANQQNNLLPGATGQGVGMWPGSTPSLPGLGGVGGIGPSLSGIGGAQPQGMFSQIGNVLGSEGFANATGAFATLGKMYTGFKSLGLAKDTLNFQKKAFNKNFNAQAKDYENTLKDRWTARNASASARGQSFQDMDKWVGSRSIDPVGKG